MRWGFVLLACAGVAHADAPTKRQAEKAAAAYVRAKDVEYEPVRQRVYFDAKFVTWQPDRKKDGIEKHRKELTKLAKPGDHAFVHAENGGLELVLAVKLDEDGEPAVDAYFESPLVRTSGSIDEAAARATVTSWVRAFGDEESKRISNGSRTGYPFWSIGLPVSKKAGCKAEQRAGTSQEMIAVSACVAGSPRVDLITGLPRTKWEVIEDPATIKTRAEADDDHFTAALDRLDRLAADHLLMFNKTTDGELTFEIVLALRGGENPVVDAAIANLY